MLTKRIAGIMLALCLAQGISGTAHASFIYDLSIKGSQATGTGKIEFASLTGTDPSGVIAFSVSGTGGPLFNAPFSVNSPSQILRIDWAIDPTTSFLSLVTLDTAEIITGVNTCLILGSNGGECTLTGWSGTGFARVRPTIFQANSLITPQSDELTVTAKFAQPVPVPATLALMIAGFVAIGYTKK